MKFVNSALVFLAAASTASAFVPARKFLFDPIARFWFRRVVMKIRIFSVSKPINDGLTHNCSASL